MFACVRIGGDSDVTLIVFVYYAQSPLFENWTFALQTTAPSSIPVNEESENLRGEYFLLPVVFRWIFCILSASLNILIAYLEAIDSVLNAYGVIRLILFISKTCVGWKHNEIQERCNEIH